MRYKTKSGKHLNCGACDLIIIIMMFSGADYRLTCGQQVVCQSCGCENIWQEMSITSQLTDSGKSQSWLSSQAVASRRPNIMTG